MCVCVCVCVCVYIYIYTYIYIMEYYSAMKKNEIIGIICCNMDGRRDYHTKISKSDREK